MKAKTLVLVVILFKVTEVQCKCKEDQVEFCYAPSKCFCRMCISCPPGYGPSHQCGGQYLNGTVIRCTPCEDSVNYSGNYSTASCEPCNVCDKKKTIRKCSVNSSSVCSSTECKVGYKMNNIVEDCFPDPAFTPDTMATTALPASQSQKANTIHSRAKFKNKTTSKSINPTATKRFSEIQSFKTTLSAPEKVKNDSHNSDNLLVFIIILVCLFGCLTFVILLLVICHMVKKVTCANPEDVENGEAGIPLTDTHPNSSNETSPRSSDESIENEKPPEPWPEGFLFKDISQDLADLLAVKISQPNIVNGWRKIGLELGVKELDLERINIPAMDGKNKGECLFEIIKASNPVLKLSKFVSVLKRLDKNDLVEEIQNEWYCLTEKILLDEENNIISTAV